MPPKKVYNRIMGGTAMPARAMDRASLGEWLTARWFVIFLGAYGLWIWLPWLAPLLMHNGAESAGRALYFIYSLFCHQLPERSFFLFGRMPMYPLAQIQAAWQDTNTPMILRQFIGNPDMGWKVAWSDRMVSVYSSIWIFGIVWWFLRRKIRALPWWGLLMFLMPVVVDGSTHAFSDLAGIGNGFRDSNLWLSSLTNARLPPAFYAGDALGSLNSWMRLITGALASLGLVWFAMPHVEASFAQS